MAEGNLYSQANVAKMAQLATKNLARPPLGGATAGRQQVEKVRTAPHAYLASPRKRRAKWFTEGEAIALIQINSAKTV